MSRWVLVNCDRCFSDILKTKHSIHTFTTSNSPHFKGQYCIVMYLTVIDALQIKILRYIEAYKI